LRALVAIPVIGLATLVLGGPALLGGLLDRSGRTPHAIARLWARIITFSCGIHVETQGLASLPEPAVFAVNHASAFDIPLLFGFLPASFRIVYKRSLSLVPFIGWYLFLGGHVAIDRANPFRAKRSLEKSAERIRRGTSVVVFPEGTRSSDGRVGHFKRGSFSLALDAGVPVVPVSLVGVKDVVPRGVLSVRPGRVGLVAHAPIPTAGLSAEDAMRLAEEARVVVARGCGQA
jgi:1-acyl-sn-glycerol-3-phosphate acyltransferase